MIHRLQASFESIDEAVTDLNEEQWKWQADSLTWSIALVVEHLVVHDELFYREMRVLLALPEMTPMNPALFASDDAILSYRSVTAENTGRSPTYLEPVGRWCSKDEAMMGYARARHALVAFAGAADKDLRAYYTTSGR